MLTLNQKVFLSQIVMFTVLFFGCFFFYFKPNQLFSVYEIIIYFMSVL